MTENKLSQSSKTKSKSKKQRSKLSEGVIIAIIGAFATILAAVLPQVFKDTSPIATATSNLSLYVPPEITDAKGAAMVLVLAGDFKMGSDNGKGDEQPVHVVYLDTYYFDKYEVTNALYKSCVDEGVCDLPQDISSYSHSNYYNNSQYVDYPVIYVDWNMAKQYCKWRGARLPTEAEWEKAATGSDSQTYPWGETISCNRANFSGCTGDTTAVGIYEGGKSVFGVYDLAGNVWEWVSDWYFDSYYSVLAENSINPHGPTNGQYPVLRGGSWIDDENNLRSAARGFNEPTIANYSVGFRCAKDSP